MRGLPVRPLFRGPSPRGLVRNPRRHLEADLQRVVIQHLNMRCVPGAVYWATPNGGARNKVTGAILKATGTKAGIPDLFILHNARLHAIELKSEGGRLSPAQHQCQTELITAGALVATAVGIDQAIDQLQQWGLIRGRTVCDVL